MQQYIILSLTPLQAAIAANAITEYQGEFEAGINSLEITPEPSSIDDLQNYTTCSVECELMLRQIEVQTGNYKI
jgi:hypothetical protein